jgi:phospholipid/cholesterol/gamma-HCH transport system permease protein
LTASQTLSKPVREVGGFFAMSLDTFVLMFRPPFAWREFLQQCWFVARVSLFPVIALSIPFNMLTIFFLNILLGEIGASDASGGATALAVIVNTGPIIAVLVVAGAGATAMCADLGARTIREELDAMRVIGIDPLQALVVPRVLAATLISFLLVSIVSLVAIASCFVFSIYVQHVTPGAFASGLTLIIGTSDVVMCLVKGAVFGVAAGLIACYKGITVGGGPQGVGNAVNETVVYAAVVLFIIDVLLTAVSFKGLQ